MQITFVILINLLVSLNQSQPICIFTKVVNLQSAVFHLILLYSMKLLHLLVMLLIMYNSICQNKFSFSSCKVKYSEASHHYVPPVIYCASG